MVKEVIPLGGDVHKISIVTDVIMNNIFKECNQKLEFLKERFPNYDYQEFNNPNFYGIEDQIIF